MGTASHRTAWKGVAWNSVVLAMASCLLGGCEARNTQSLASFPQSRISVQDAQQVVAGTLANMQPYLPAHVSVIPTVNRASSGPGYIVQLDWSYTAPSVPSTTEWTVQWELNAFSGQDTNSLQPVFVGGPQYFSPGDKLEWVSNSPLDSNQYVIELSAFVIVMVNGTPSNDGGIIILKKIGIDLRGL